MFETLNMKTIATGPRFLYLPGGKGKFLHIYRSKQIPYAEDYRRKFVAKQKFYLSLARKNISKNIE